MHDPISPSELLQHRRFVRSLALQLVHGDGHRADDLTQQTLLIALERPPQQSAALRGWLGTVLRNLVRDGWRRKQRRRAREERAARPEATPATDSLAARAEEHRRVVDLVLELPPSWRDIVLMRFFEGLPPREIAERTGIPAATVRSRLHRALARVREAYEREHGAEWRGALALLTVPLGAGGLGSGSASVGASPRVGGALAGALMSNAPKALVLTLVGLLALGGAVWLVADDAAPAEDPVATAPGPTDDTERRGARRERPTDAPAESEPEREETTAIDEAPPVVAPVATQAHPTIEARFSRYLEPRKPPPGVPEVESSRDLPEIKGTRRGGGGFGGMGPVGWTRWPEPPDDDGVTLVGTVRDADGRPVEGATVLRIDAERKPQAAGVISFQFIDEIATTDADGRFEATGQPARAMHVYANFNRALNRPRGLAVDGALTITPTADERVAGLDVTLPIHTGDLAGVRGSLRDVDGNGVRQGRLFVGYQEVRPDADGSFEVQGLNPGAVTIRWQAGGYQPIQQTLDLAPRETGAVDLVAELADVGSLSVSGRVVDDGGNAVADVPLYLGGPRYTQARHTRTDDDGRFTFDRLDDRLADSEEGVSVSVMLHPEQGPALEPTGVRGVKVPTRDLELVVQRQARVHVRLLDGRTGEPLRVYRFQLEQAVERDGETIWSPKGSHSAWDDGGTTTKRLSPGRWRAQLRAKGYRGAEFVFDLTDAAGEERDLVLELQPE